MAEDSFSLDSLLEDLEAVHAAPQNSNLGANNGTVKFVPHPPARDKQASQTTTFNPKTRFVHNLSGSNSPESAPVSHHNGNSSYNNTFLDTHRGNNNSDNNGGNTAFAGKSGSGVSGGLYSSPSSSSYHTKQPATTTTTNTNTNLPSAHTTIYSAHSPSKDENSIDNLLNLMASPTQPTQYNHSNSKPYNSGATTTYNDYTNNNNTGSTNKLTTSTTANSTYKNNPSYHTNNHTIAADAHILSPFDSPVSANSLHKTHAFTPTNNHTTHSTSMYNMSTNSANREFHSNSFDSSGDGEKVSAFNSPTTTVFNNNNSASLQPIGASHDANYYNNKNKSGSGVSGSLFNSSSGNNNNNNYNTSNTSYTTPYTNNNGPLHSPKGGNTATFASQNESKTTHFLPSSINATTVVSNNNSNTTNTNNSSSSSGGSGNGAAKLKCSRVVIGGVNIPRGRKTSAFAHFACNNLRCLQCNFKVHCFTNSEWDSSVDYMFLRNTVPNEAKLALKLTPSAEKCAYCCQCSSASEGEERELNGQLSASAPQWVCAGH